MNTDKSPAFRLVNQGFDVWLGNSRGTKYSRKNIHYDPHKDGDQYYGYSFYELGKYDAPAQIDYVLG